MHDLFGFGPRSNGMSLALAISAAAAALLSACDEPPLREWRPEDHGHEQLPPGADNRAEPAEDSEPVSAEEAQARATLALWNVTCATCHARDGRGGGPGLPPGAKVPDMTDPAFGSSHTDEQLVASIRDGKGMMPAFGQKLGETGVAVMASHVRQLSAAAAPAPAPVPAKQDAPAP